MTTKTWYIPTVLLDQLTTSFWHLLLSAQSTTSSRLRANISLLTLNWQNPLSTSYNSVPPRFLVVLKYSKAITAEIRCCTSNTTLLADDSQNCVSLKILMITASQSPNLNNQRCLPMYSKTQYTGNPFLYPAMPSKSIPFFPPNDSQTRLQTSTIIGKHNVSFTIINAPPPSVCWLNHCWNRNSSTVFSERRPRPKIISQSFPAHPCPSK